MNVQLGCTSFHETWSSESARQFEDEGERVVQPIAALSVRLCSLAWAILTQSGTLNMVPQRSDHGTRKGSLARGADSSSAGQQNHPLRI